jgi:amino acid transporter
MNGERPHRAGLERVIGVGGVAFAAFNCIVGVGIFALPASVAAVLGPAAILAFAVCLVLIGFVGLCLAEAGSRVPGNGGLYAYATAAFGPVLGGVAGTLYFFATCVGSAAALARFALDTLAQMWPAAAQPAMGLTLLALVYSVLVAVNILGTRDGTRLTIAIGFVKLAPMIVLILFGLFSIQSSNLAWSEVPPVSKVGEAALLLVFAFIGVESGLSVSGETRAPARTIPRAIALALVLVAALYIGLQMTAQGVLGSMLAGSKAPIADTAGAVFGPSGSRLFFLLTLVSATGYLIADILTAPRIAFALAESKQLPSGIAYIHPRFHTPAVAIPLYAGLVVAATASGTFRQIVVLATSGTLLVYMIVCLGVIRLRAKSVRGEGAPFVAPGGIFVPIAATAIMIWLLSSLARKEVIAVFVFVAATALIYAVNQRRAVRRGSP